jgi:hypothetical protein
MYVLSVVFTVLRFDVEMGLVNGSTGTVVDFRMHEATHEISAVLVKFPNIDSPITIQREAYSFEVLKSIYFTRKQFPLMSQWLTKHWVLQLLVRLLLWAWGLMLESWAINKQWHALHTAINASPGA